jgi:hypothetical protein
MTLFQFHLRGLLLTANIHYVRTSGREPAAGRQI